MGWFKNLFQRNTPVKGKALQPKALSINPPVGTSVERNLMRLSRITLMKFQEGTTRFDEEIAVRQQQLEKLGVQFPKTKKDAQTILNKAV